MKKIIKYAIIVALLLWTFPVKAADKINVYLFYGDGCPHCVAEKEFLDELKGTYPNMEVHEYETWHNGENSTLVSKVKNALNISHNYVPFTVISKTTYTGFSDNTGYQIEKKIKEYDGREEDIVSKVIKSPNNYTVKKEASSENVEGDTVKEDKQDNTVVVPLLGKVNAKSVSLPVLAVVIGAVDGFNPCAMWILLLLISMLLGMKNRKRMWILGLTFLVTSAFVYLLFMISWLGVAKMVTSVGFIRMIIAAVALIAGCIHLRNFFKHDEDGCDIVSDDKRKKMFAKIKKFTAEKSLVLALLGIMTLAASVNLIELACSAGLPLLFTQVLAMNDLSSIQYSLYIFLYIFFFLLDDIIVFVLAMVSMKMTGLSTKYSRYSHLVGGIIMVIIGVLLLVNPGLLMFNF